MEFPFSQGPVSTNPPWLSVSITLYFSIQKQLEDRLTFFSLNKMQFHCFYLFYWKDTTHFKSFFFLHQVNFLIDKFVKDRMRSFLTSNKSRYNKGIIFNVDDTKDMSISIKSINLGTSNPRYLFSTENLTDDTNLNFVLASLLSVRITIST